MPELAEVEFYRKQWNCGLKEKILSVHLHATKRIFRGTNTGLLQQALTGSTLLASRAHGKQMLFHFSNDAWLGIHLGMSGRLRVEKRGENPFIPGRHDHLVLSQEKQDLIFSDPRQFGRVLFHPGKHEPPWWTKLPPALTSNQFTTTALAQFLAHHRKAPIKAVLLLQDGFPGVGNWMADEILWRSRIHPKIPAGNIDGAPLKNLFRETRFVCREALQIIGKDFSNPPKSWLFQHRWEKGGRCPRCKSPLQHATIGGRTTCWCPRCQH